MHFLLILILLVDERSLMSIISAKINVVVETKRKKGLVLKTSELPITLFILPRTTSNTIKYPEPKFEWYDTALLT